MKALLIVLVMAMGYGAVAQVALDKQKHFAAGATISAISYGMAYDLTENNNKSIWAGVTMSVTAGVVKETIDSKQPGNRFDPYDLLATTLGGITVGITIKLSKRNEKINK